MSQGNTGKRYTSEQKVSVGLVRITFPDTSTDAGLARATGMSNGTVKDCRLNTKNLLLEKQLENATRELEDMKKQLIPPANSQLKNLIYYY